MTHQDEEDLASKASTIDRGGLAGHHKSYQKTEGLTGGRDYDIKDEQIGEVSQILFTDSTRSKAS